jgi:hypothetical protein
VRERLDAAMSELAVSVGHAGGYRTTVYFDLEGPWLPAPAGPSEPVVASASHHRG